jgi:hypothetical protein
VLDLDQSQVEEMEVLGTVTLAPSQWESLRKSCKSVPKRFSTVLATTYKDCTCDMNNYCIALNARQVAVLCFDDEVLSTFTLSWQLGESPIQMDRRGQCYVEGAQIPFQTLLAAIAGGPQRGLESEIDSATTARYIHIRPAPLDTRNSPALSSRITKIREVARQAGWGSIMEDDIVSENSYAEPGARPSSESWLDYTLKRR